MLIVIIAIVSILVLLDQFINRKEQMKLRQSEEYRRHVDDERERLSSLRFIYIIFYVVMIIVLGFVTNMQFGFTTEPDVNSIIEYEKDGRIIFTQDPKEIFVKRADHDTNGWYWGGFFIVYGLFGIFVKASFVTAKIPINAYGNIQYIVNILLICIGIFMIFRVPIYDFMGWNIGVEYSYYDFLKSFGLKKQG